MKKSEMIMHIAGILSHHYVPNSDYKEVASLILDTMEIEGMIPPDRRYCDCCDPNHEWEEE